MNPEKYKTSKQSEQDFNIQRCILRWTDTQVNFIKVMTVQ